jgi:hypothetical protein
MTIAPARQLFRTGPILVHQPMNPCHEIRVGMPQRKTKGLRSHGRTRRTLFAPYG